MLSIVIPTLNAAQTLPATLASLAPARGNIACEIVASDGGSSDETRAVAEAHGALTVEAPRGRGQQLRAGADAARGDWLLFLHADTVLEAGWHEEVARFLSDPTNARRAAVFRFEIDDGGRGARRLEAIVAWRWRLLGLPYGDQGLLISRDFYLALRGFRPIPLMEDVDLVRRIGRRRLTQLDAAARTSAMRYRRAGYIQRSARNLLCLTLFFLGVKPDRLVRLYG